LTSKLIRIIDVDATDMKIDTESNSIPENPKIPRVGKYFFLKYITW